MDEHQKKDIPNLSEDQKKSREPSESQSPKTLKDQLFHEFEKRYENEIEVACARIATEILDGVGSGGKLAEMIAEKIAHKWVADHYIHIADKVSIDVIVKMIHLKAIGKAFQ